jgi:hypothetical protein
MCLLASDRSGHERFYFFFRAYVEKCYLKKLKIPSYNAPQCNIHSGDILLLPYFTNSINYCTAST